MSSEGASRREMSRGKVRFVARKGSHLTHEDATIIGPILYRLIESSEGPLSPEVVVQEARSRDSPLHPYFDWNDKEASDNWRVHQARMMISHIQIVVEGRNDPPVRVFYNVVDADTRGYVTMNRVLSNEEYHRQVVEKALQEVERWRVRYHQYSELEPIFIAIRQVRRR